MDPSVSVLSVTISPDPIELGKPYMFMKVDPIVRSRGDVGLSAHVINKYCATYTDKQDNSNEYFAPDLQRFPFPSKN